MSTHGPAPTILPTGNTTAPATGGGKSRDPAFAAKLKLREALNHEAAKEIWYAVAAFIFVLIVVRLVDIAVTSYQKSRISARLQRLSTKEGTEALPASASQGRVSLRRLPNAIASAFRIVAFRTTLPVGPGSIVTVADASVIASYILAILLLEFTRTRQGMKDPQIFFWADRAATIGASQITLVVALAGKNGTIAWLTGISHEKLNVIHRACGRLLVLLFWLHAMGRVKNGLTFVHGLETLWMKAGVMALTALTTSFLVSLRPIRKLAFEFFLIVHIITITLFIAGGMVHRPAVKYYFWPGFLVWGLDRGLRFARVFFYNLRWWRSGDKLTNGHIELIADSTVRLTISRPMDWKAGQHAYVVMPTVSRFPFEAHPFTIASISEKVDGTPSTGDKELVFLIRGQKGFTERLSEHAGKNGQGSVSCVVDGPYGFPPELVAFDVSILVAGGSGISYTLPLLLDAVRNAKLGKSAVRRIVFIWAIRNAADIQWISNELLSALNAAPAHLSIEPRIYVTRADSAFPAMSYSEDDLKLSFDSSDEVENKKSAETLLSVLRVELGRPNIEALFQAELEAAQNSRVSVDVAGPSALASSVRSTLRSAQVGPSAVLRGGPDVTLHVETFSH